jgi:hypothetical protein
LKIDKLSTFNYHKAMGILFTPKEVDQIRQAWEVLYPKVNAWLAAEQARIGSNPGSVVGQPQARLYWHDFIQPVKDVLQAAPNHRLTLEQVYNAIEQKMKSKFTARDSKVLTSGIVRWKTFVNQVGVDLRKKGYLDPNEDRGVWRVI